jgi:hypothetical protein
MIEIMTDNSKGNNEKFVLIPNGDDAAIEISISVNKVGKSIFKGLKYPDVDPNMNLYSISKSLWINGVKTHLETETIEFTQPEFDQLKRLIDIQT